MADMTFTFYFVDIYWLGEDGLATWLLFDGFIIDD